MYKPLKNPVRKLTKVPHSDHLEPGNWKNEYCGIWENRQLSVFRVEWVEKDEDTNITDSTNIVDLLSSDIKGVAENKSDLNNNRNRRSIGHMDSFALAHVRNACKETEEICKLAIETQKNQRE